MLKYAYVLLLVFVGAVVANEEDVQAELKTNYREIDAQGHFNYGYEASNGVEAKVQGDVNGIQGEYFLPGENGEKVRVAYTADSTGFHPNVEKSP
ncbi:PREDICTED: pupal cuticle protein Edg-78E [Bactrocera latifrons]|uniref:pupal cuticle protein Edg-78E n=1 Tax=Bactrocera latifrons TaxID=174628 RepID=UPI0008DDCA73|nr:PREDICTED: pupal cuticle protein Edg-78E [Bactrocera latifrons]